jgi:predicted nucleic acid-binding protein
MILLDTDILTLFLMGHAGVIQKVQAAEEVPATTVVSRIEILQGRFDSVLKAADASELVTAQERLAGAEEGLAKFAVVPITAAAASEFDRLRQEKKLKKIGRADLLIAGSPWLTERSWSHATYATSSRSKDCLWRIGPTDSRSL